MSITLAASDDHVPASRQANRAEAAEFFGVSQTTIQNWVQRGCPYMTRGERGTPWVFDLLAMAIWKYGAGEVSADGDDPEQMPPKERLDYYKGCRERDLHKKERGELVSMDEVVAGWAKIVQVVKARFLSLPLRLSPAVVAISDLREAEDRIEKEVLLALEDLSESDST